MKVCGIIAEYNPFHNGHALQIEKTRQQGATHIVAIMSGNFVQRGDVALFSKWARARACIKNGVDLVLELPTPFAMAPARDFANAAVQILLALQGQQLSFGSECVDVNLLRRTAEYCQLAENTTLFVQLIEQGVSHPQAREQAVRTIFGADYVTVLQQPNNLLGIEYLRAICELEGDIEVVTIPREGAAHDAAETSEHIASASWIREQILTRGLESVRAFVPETAFAVYEQELLADRAPCSLQALDKALLYRLRSSTARELEQIADVAEGLENRLLRAGNACTGFAEAVDFICTKRYTKARIRRILCNVLLGIHKGDFSKKPQYGRVLGMNERGMELLKKAKGNSDFPLTAKFSQLHQAGFSQAIFETRATDLYMLTCPKIRVSATEFTEPVFVNQSNDLAKK